MSWPFRKLVTAFRGRYMRASSISREGLNLAPFSILIGPQRKLVTGPGGTAFDGTLAPLVRSGTSGKWPGAPNWKCVRSTVELGATSSSLCIQISRTIRNIPFDIEKVVNSLTIYEFEWAREDTVYRCVADARRIAVLGVAEGSANRTHQRR